MTPSSSDYTLAYGTHATPDDGRCAMEWVSYLAGEPHSDEPVCVSPVLRALCIGLNDGLQDEPRQRLRPYLARTIGTAGDGLDPARAWMAMDWLIRVYTPAWLRLAGLAGLTSLTGDGDALAGLTRDGDALAGLAPVIEESSLAEALRVLEGARNRARSARAHEFDPSRATGGGLALRVPRPGALTAGLAGREAAWTCAGAAAWAAARIAIGDLAGDRARAAARAAAGDAAAIVVRRAQPAEARPRSVLRQHAEAVLAPTLAALAQSAIGLLDRMLPTESLALQGPGSGSEAVFTTSV